MTPQIKICGLTSPQEVQFLKENGVEYAGIVLFYEKSKRNNTCENAEVILSEIKKAGGIKTAAVVVSPDMEQIELIEKMGFDILQVHGNLTSDIIKNVNIPVFLAIHVNSEVSIVHYMKEPKIQGIVFDGKVPGAGKTFDWSQIKNIDRKDKLLILAGGLEENNVNEAVRMLSPDMVDVSTGVEYLNDETQNNAEQKLLTGKDPLRIKRFVDAVRNTEI